MNKKRFALASVATFILLIGLGVLFGYIELSIFPDANALWRKNLDPRIIAPIGFLFTAVLSFLFVYIYAKGYEPAKSRLGQGLRYGVLMGLLIGTVAVVDTYLTFPIPGKVAVLEFAICWVEFLIIGSAIGLIYKA